MTSEKANSDSQWWRSAVFYQIYIRLYFYDPVLRNNPPAHGYHRNNMGTDANPYHGQQHLYDKNRPENAEFMEQVRASTDQYPGTTTMGKVGETSRKRCLIPEQFQDQITRRTWL